MLLPSNGYSDYAHHHFHNIPQPNTCILKLDLLSHFIQFIKNKTTYLFSHLIMKLDVHHHLSILYLSMIVIFPN